MNGDLRTLVTQLRGPAFSQGERRFRDAAADLIQSMVPLYDAWLTARPPCPTCMADANRSGLRGWIVNDSTGYSVHAGYPCTGCPGDGIQPFDKWTAGLVALWTAVWDRTFVVEPMWLTSWIESDREPFDHGVEAAFSHLRQISGAR